MNSAKRTAQITGGGDMENEPEVLRCEIRAITKPNNNNGKADDLEQIYVGTIRDEEGRMETKIAQWAQVGEIGGNAEEHCAI